MDIQTSRYFLEMAITELVLPSLKQDEETRKKFEPM
jgi:hypothetical protein